MKFEEAYLKDLYIIEPEPYKDERGMFFRTFCKKEFAVAGLEKEFVQINQSINNKKGTLRGLHYQIPPPGDTKLIRCISGRVFDILVDIRKGSKTFLNYFAIELSAENKRMVLITGGFAHGFLTLEDNTQLVYHHTSYYKPELEAGINYKDPKINLILPEAVRVITERDSNIPFLNDQFEGF